MSNVYKAANVQGCPPPKLTANTPQKWCETVFRSFPILGANRRFEKWPALSLKGGSIPHRAPAKISKNPTRWFKPWPFHPLVWRSLSYWKGSLNHPKKVTSRIARYLTSGVFDSEIPHALFGVFGVRGVIGVLGVLASDGKRKTSAIWRSFLKNLAAHRQVTGLPGLPFMLWEMVG